MPTLFDLDDRILIRRRLESLVPTQQARWGKFTAPEMVCHVSAGLRQGLGEIEPGSPSGPMTVPGINWLVIHVVPWPKTGAKSPPGLLTTKPTTWDKDVAALQKLIERFGQRGAKAKWPPSSAFGSISGRSWGVLQYRHLDHHFRQFSI
jgi:hypothetical protein